MGIKFRSTFDPKKYTSKIQQETEKRLNQYAQVAVTEIQVRTGNGIDANGAQFKPYSPSYAEVKRERTGKTNVNLTWSGDMLKGIQSKVERVNGNLRAVIYVSGASVIGRALSALKQKKSISNAEKVRHNEALGRHFFALSKGQFRALRALFKNLIR